MAEESGNWENCLYYAAMTDVGMRRADNQDAHAVMLAADQESWRRRGHLFVVADGMGAHAAGELASELAVVGIPHHYHRYPDLSPPEALAKAFQEANAEVHRRGQANPDFLHMGTTASALVLLPQGALAAHVGDSRVYRLRGDSLDQLTFDHSLVWEMGRAAGQRPGQNDFSGTIPKNVITRSLGPNARVQVDVEGPFPLEARDTFLICSDGLTCELEDAELGPILGHLPPLEAARLMVDLANLRGGPDNITATIVKIVGERLGGRAADTQPLTLGGGKRSGALHPAFWGAASVCVLAAMGLSVAGRPVLALLAAAAGAAALGAGVLKRLREKPKGVALSEGRRLGEGPYTHTDCLSLADFVGGLRATVQQFSESVASEERRSGTNFLDESCRKAASAAEAGRDTEALRGYAAVVRRLAKYQRSQAANGARNSVTDQ